jgi:hypothetical protein
MSLTTSSPQGAATTGTTGAHLSPVGVVAEIRAAFTPVRPSAQSDCVPLSLQEDHLEGPGSDGSVACGVRGSDPRCMPADREQPAVVDQTARARLVGDGGSCLAVQSQVDVVRRELVANGRRYCRRAIAGARRRLHGGYGGARVVRSSGLRKGGVSVQPSAGSDLALQAILGLSELEDPGLRLVVAERGALALDRLATSY